MIRPIPITPTRIAAAGGLLLSFSLASFAGWPALLYSQPAVEFRGPSCVSCELVLEKVAVLGGSSSDFEITRTSPVTRDGGGNFYVASAREPGVIGVFDSGGRFVRRIGRRGQGPGEFQQPHALIGGRGDTLHVLDLGLQRYTRIRGSGALVSVAPLRVPEFPTVAVMPSGALAMGSVASGPTPQWSVGIFGGAGDTLGSYVSPRSLASVSPTGRRRFILPGRGGGELVAVAVNRYDVYTIAVADGKTSLMTRSVPWFPGWEQLRLSLPYRNPTQSYVTGVGLSETGQMNILIQVAEDPYQARIESGSPPLSAWGDYMDTYVEVVDVALGAVIVSQRFDKWLHSVVGSELVYEMLDDADGIVSFHVYRAVLRGR